MSFLRMKNIELGYSFPKRWMQNMLISGARIFVRGSNLLTFSTVSYTHLDVYKRQGVALATLALVCTLSVFNGFQDMVASFFTAFDPQLKITVREGKVFDAQDVYKRQGRGSENND